MRTRTLSDPTTQPSPEDATSPPEKPVGPDHPLYQKFLDFCRTHVRIVNKDGQLVPLELNFTQRFIVLTIFDLMSKGLPPRLIVLKSRQVGVSTVIEALLFFFTMELSNRSSLVVAHNEKSTKTLFRMVRRMLQNLPPGTLPKKKYDNVREIHFDHNDSRVQVETVGEVRGYTAQYVHLSEYGFWENAKESFIAIMQAVPKTPDSLVVIESTANGVGNHFHELWRNAVRRSNDPSLPPQERGWTPIFVPWFVHEEYQEQPWFGPDDVLHSERMLFQAHPKKITMRRLAWRRSCLDTNCDGDEEKFRQEYPATENEAFLTSGRPAFDRDGLAFYMSQVPPTVPMATLPEEQEIEWDEEQDKPILIPTKRGRLRIYEMPKKRHSYILGADPSEGDPGSDPSPIAVLDQQTLNLVAVWHGRQPPEQLKLTAIWLAKLYNDGLIINEANNHGIAFQQAHADLYHNIYYRQANPESVAEEYTLKPGFMTTTKTRHALIDSFRKFVREKAKHHKGSNTRMIRCPILVDEMTTLVYKQKPGVNNTKVEAQQGHKDDLCIAFALALWAHRGSIEAPLEPIPETEMRASIDQYHRIKERDADGAERFALDFLNMTCEQIEEALDDQAARERRRMHSGGFGRMT